MASILCPHCEAVHEIDQPFQSLEGKKVRCASCRQTFAVQHEVSMQSSADAAQPLSSIPALPPESANHAENDIFMQMIKDEDQEKAALSSDDVLPSGWDAPSEEVEVMDDEDKSPFSAMSYPLDHQNGSSIGSFAPEPADSDGARREKPVARKKRGAKTRLSARKFNPFSLLAPDKNEASQKPVRRTMVMAAGFATLLAVGMVRHDIVRVVPQAAPIFDVIGLPVNLYGLEFNDIKSRITKDAQGETLEITGTIRNVSSQVRRIPVLRLAIQNAGSQDVFVWTAHADIQDIAPGETHQFRRRLASPPLDSHHVVVRFLAKDDVITAIQ